MTTAAEVEAVLRSEIGYTESPAGSNQNKFGAWYGWNGVPWCAIFISWGLYTAFHAHGEKSPVEDLQHPKGFAYTGAVITWAKDRSLWSTTPAYGALALYDWDSRTRPGPDHIGWVSQVDTANPDAFTAIEGNTAVGNDSNGGQVLARNRRNDRGYCLGFVRIPYASAPPGVGVAAPVWPGRSLALTSPLTSGADVATWQGRMYERGWHEATVGGVARPFTADGIYGEVSDAVCRAFQREKQLIVDGVVGPATWRATWSSPVAR